MKAERNESGRLTWCWYCGSLIGDGCDGECARARFARLWATTMVREPKEGE